MFISPLFSSIVKVKGLQLPEDSYSVLKKGMTMTRIGLYGVPLDSQTPASTNTAPRVESCVNRYVRFASVLSIKRVDGCVRITWPRGYDTDLMCDKWAIIPSDEGLVFWLLMSP